MSIDQVKKMVKLYDRFTKVVDADFPRFSPHSTIPAGSTLSIVFDHYRIRHEWKDLSRKQINLFFLSGTGMSKAIWQYHIDKLFHYSDSHPDLPWQIVNCIALDLVNHGESAVENDGRLGWELDWREGSHDLVKVAQSVRLSGENVLIGHSMGGFQSLYATAVAPLLFKFAIVIEPVTPGDLDHGKIFITKRFPLLAKLIRSEFKDEAEFYNHFESKSFYNKVHPEIKKVFFDSEKIVHKNGTVSSKCSKEQQLICYLAVTKLWNKLGKDILSMVPVPIVHVIGANAKWNSPQAVETADKLIPDIESLYIQGGTHLVHIEQPDETIEVFINSLNKHTKKADNELLATSQSNTLSKEEYDKIFLENYRKYPAVELLEKYQSKL